MKPTYWNKGKLYLSNKDKVLKKIIDKFTNQSLQLNNNSFHALVNSIIGQQISVSAANSMKNKLFVLKRNITPRTIKNINKTNLRKCGLSKQKILYINNIADFFLKNKEFVNQMHKTDDQEIRNKLIEINPITVFNGFEVDSDNLKCQEKKIKNTLTFRLGKLILFPFVFMKKK